MSIITKNNNSLLETIPHGTKYRPIEEICLHIGGPSFLKEKIMVEQHWHPEIEFIYVERGSLTAEVNLDQSVLRPGDFMFAGAQDLHAIKGQDNEETKHETLIFLPKALTFSYHDEIQETLLAPLLSGEITFPHYLKPEDEGYEKLAPRILEVINIAKEQPDNWYIECKLLLIKLLYYMKENGFLIPAEDENSSQQKKKIERYKILTTYMEEHLSEQITLEELANMTATNPQYLCRFFKEISGISPIQHLINRRIEAAATLLRDTDDSILEIAMECGFDNVSYFIRKFKQQKGMTPGAFREH